MVQLNLAEAVSCYERGVVLAEQGQFLPAAAAFEEALRVQPTYLEAKIALGRALTDMFDIEAALDVLHEAFEQAPTHAGVLAALGMAYYEEEDTEEAINYWEPMFHAECEELSPALAEEIGILLIAALADMRDFTRALAVLACLERLLPESPLVQFTYAEVCYVMGAFDESLQHAERALRLDDEYEDALLLMGKIYLAREDYERAIAAVTAARTLDAELPGVNATLALIFLRQGKADEALLLAEAVMRQEEIYTEESHNCALVYAATGQPDTAEELWREILVEDPEDEKAFTALLELAVATKKTRILTWCRKHVPNEDPDLLATLNAYAQRITPGSTAARKRRTH